MFSCTTHINVSIGDTWPPSELLVTEWGWGTPVVYGMRLLTVLFAMAGKWKLFSCLPNEEKGKKSTVCDAKHFTLKQMRSCHLCQRGWDWRLLRQARHKEAHTALPLSREDCPVVHLIAVEGRMLVMGCWGEWLERLISGFYAKYKHRHEVLCTSVGYSVWRQW